MGNCCGSQSDDNFQGVGRTVGAPPPQSNAKASVPSQIASTDGPSTTKVKAKVGGPGRTLGSGGSENDARAAAAAAAEVRSLESQSQLQSRSRVAPMMTMARANKSPGTHDLAKKLAEQKKQTQNQTLQQVAWENRAARDADAATETRNYN